MIANELHKALSGAQRFSIVGLLLTGKKSREELLTTIGCKSNGLTQDLTKLKKSGLISVTKKNHRCTYFLAPGVKSGKSSVVLNGQRVTYL